MSLGRLVRCFGLTVFCVVSSAGLVACSSEDPDSNGDTEDLPEEVTVKVGASGGTVKAKGVSLVIPEGALDKDVMISAKKIDADKVVMPKNAKEAVSAVFEFGPKGTMFKKDVTVQLNTEKEEPTAKVFFTKENSDTEFEQLQTANEGKVVAAKTKHFSLGFAGIPADVVAGMPDGGTAGMDSGTGGRLDAGSGGDSGASRLDSGASQNDAGDSLPDATVVQQTTITVKSKDPYGFAANQTWMAYQDGDGAWQPVFAAPTGTYTFNINSQRYGLAYVCAGAASSGQVLFASSALEQVNIAQMAYCTGTAPPMVKRSGSIVPPTGGPSSGNFRYTHRWNSGTKAWASTGDLSYSFDKILANMSTDLVFGIDFGGGAPVKMNVVRGLAMSLDDFQGQNLDTGGIVPTADSLNVLGVEGAAPQVFVEYTVDYANTGMRISDDPIVEGSMAMVDFATLPYANHFSNDRHRLYASDTVAAHSHAVESFTTLPGPYQLTLPPDFNASIVQAGGYEHFAPTATFADVPGASEYTLFFNYVAAPNAHFFTTRVEKDWFPAGESTHTITFPEELVSLPNFQAGWLPATTSVVTASAAVLKITSDANSSMVVTSEVSATLPANNPP